MKLFFIATMLFLGAQASAMDFNPVTEILKAQGLLDKSVKPLGLEWKVGDNAQYNINMGFISGTMDMRVREETSEGFWMNQDADLGFLGKQLIEIHINKNTGEIIEMRVNGQKQTPPESGNQEIVDMQEANITVPAGTFECVYLKIRDNSNNQESEAWLNPETIPMTGLVKTIQPGQFGEVVVELTGFQKL
ncbi:MAG: hypothetical protein H6625_13650 [Bdellovibrionaceae bacterium]|nr:hypothetical protein [Pseudobdellovibrionaceae bacterium]